MPPGAGPVAGHGPGQVTRRTTAPATPAPVDGAATSSPYLLRLTSPRQNPSASPGPPGPGMTRDVANPGQSIGAPPAARCHSRGASPLMNPSQGAAMLAKDATHEPGSGTCPVVVAYGQSRGVSPVRYVNHGLGPAMAGNRAASPDSIRYVNHGLGPTVAGNRGTSPIRSFSLQIPVPVQNFNRGANSVMLPGRPPSLMQEPGTSCTPSRPLPATQDHGIGEARTSSPMRLRQVPPIRPPTPNPPVAAENTSAAESVDQKNKESQFVTSADVQSMLEDDRSARRTQQLDALDTISCMVDNKVGDAMAQLEQLSHACQSQFADIEERLRAQAQGHSDESGSMNMPLVTLKVGEVVESMFPEMLGSVQSRLDQRIVEAVDALAEIMDEKIKDALDNLHVQRHSGQRKEREGQATGAVGVSATSSKAALARPNKLELELQTLWEDLDQRGKKIEALEKTMASAIEELVCQQTTIFEAMQSELQQPMEKMFTDIGKVQTKQDEYACLLDSYNRSLQELSEKNCEGGPIDAEPMQLQLSQNRESLEFLLTTHKQHNSAIEFLRGQVNDCCGKLAEFPAEEFAQIQGISQSIDQLQSQLNRNSECIKALQTTQNQDQHVGVIASLETRVRCAEHTVADSKEIFEKVMEEFDQCRDTTESSLKVLSRKIEEVRNDSDLQVGALKSQQKCQCTDIEKLRIEQDKLFKEARGQHDSAMEAVQNAIKLQEAQLLGDAATVGNKIDSDSGAVQAIQAHMKSQVDDMRSELKSEIDASQRQYMKTCCSIQVVQTQQQAAIKALQATCAAQPAATISAEEDATAKSQTKSAISEQQQQQLLDEEGPQLKMQRRLAELCGAIDQLGAMPITSKAKANRRLLEAPMEASAKCEMTSDHEAKISEIAPRYFIGELEDEKHEI